MQRELLKKVIADQREGLISPHVYFEREQMDTIRSHVKDPHAIIITGIRRSGKSTLLKMLQRESAEADYFINFDDDRLIQFKLEHFQMLHEVFIELFGVQNTFYFDEIQNIPGWERFVRRLHDQNYKIFITGSNATLLSRELGTRLTGRFIPIEIYPLSFKEIAQHEHATFSNKQVFSTVETGQLLRCFASYIEKGGIPDFVKYGQVEYLKSLYDGILFRDIIVRHGISNEKPIKELAYYLASNIGKEFSYNNLCKILGLGSSNTISNYCDYLESCYLCFFLNRYSHSLQKQIHYNKKCYMIDPALIRMIGFRVSEDRGRLLENVVFLHLKSKGKEIFFHKEKKECDFVLRKGHKIYQAIQVATHLDDQKLKERELSGLLEAMQAYNLNEGLILTENHAETLEVTEGETSYRICILPIWKWLLDSL